jgi:acyl-CoA dehydrogenase
VLSDPFLEARHLELLARVRAFGDQRLRPIANDESDPSGQTRVVVARLAATGFLPHAVPAPYGAMDLRSLVVVREALAYFSSLADTAFAMQGLGSHPVSLAGTEVQKSRWLPAVVGGKVLAAFAVTEPEAGSDVAGIRTRAERDGALWRLHGVKALISNAGIAGLYTVLARSPEELSTSWWTATPRACRSSLEPWPLRGDVRFEGVPACSGQEGSGRAGDPRLFRPSAACGLARRAWTGVRTPAPAEQAALGSSRPEMLAEMHVELEAARLLVRHAAWTRDQGQERIAREGAMAKLYATEAAQRVVDRAVQLHGGQGVVRGATVERLYREVRALRIYEGTSEILKLVIAREILKEKR